MDTRSVTRRRFSAAPAIKKVPAPSHNSVAKGTKWSPRGGRVIFLDENGNEIADEGKPSCQEPNKSVSKEGQPPRRDSSLLAKRRSSSLDAARMVAWYNNRSNSSMWRDQFLQSFGKTTIRYPNLQEDDIKEDLAHLNVPMRSSIEEAEAHPNDSDDFKRRAQSAGPVLMRSPSNAKSTMACENLLQLRGSEYTGEPPHLDLTTKIRKQSAKRRIKRIMEAEKEKEERERLAMEENSDAEKKTHTLRSATFAVMAVNVSAAGFSFKSFTEKKKWLAEKREWTRQIASSKFRWGTRVVIVLGRVLKALIISSAHKTPETATQRSFRTLREDSEVKEILFNKSLYQRGKSQYAYVPEWAKKILAKSAIERTKNDLSQLHSMLKGLTSYDKFTYRIQLAMCRAMTYNKVEYPRVVLRKGHIGVSFYFIFSGSVFVNVEELLMKTGHVMWHTAITLQRGDSFGELSLLRNIRRTASVVVREDAELLVVEKDVFSKTCPIIFDKELAEKIKFCKSLSLFNQWTDDALKNVCIEAQIQELKTNKVIVKDSSKELDWIYFCMHGKCSVIKVLDLHVPPKLSHSKRVTNEEIHHPLGLARRKRRIHDDTSKIWVKELHESLKTPYSFAESKKVDEHRCNDERNVWSNSADHTTGAEKILEVMNAPYKDQPHAKGDSSYIVNKDDEDENDKDFTEYGRSVVEAIPVELEKRDKNVFEDFSELIQTETKTGKLNKDVVYLNIASMKSGDIFDVSQVVRPTGQKLMLVSKGAVMLKIKRDDFFRYSTKKTLRQARKVVQELDYPPEDIIYRSYNERCVWEQLKSYHLRSTMDSIQEKCIRHNNTFTQRVTEIKRPMTPARVDSGPSRLKRFDQFLSFVYGSHKVPDNEPQESVSSSHL